MDSRATEQPMNPRAEIQLPKPPRSEDTRMPAADTIRAAVKVTYTCRQTYTLGDCQAFVLMGIRALRLSCADRHQADSSVTKAGVWAYVSFTEC